MIDKNRLLAITDGIVAVAATIMVLQLDVPDKASLAAISAQWPTLMAYIISFLQIFLAWHEHHDSFAFAQRINHRVFLMNCAWLFFITLLPFVTGMIGNAPDHMPSVLLYIAILALVQVTITMESRMLQRLNHTGIMDADIIRQIRIITLVGYGIAAIVSVMAPVIGLAVILALTLVVVILVCLYDRRSGQEPG